MIALNHVLAGTAIALAVKQPALVAPLAFASHFVLDALPHFSYRWPGFRFQTIWAMDAAASTLAVLYICWAFPPLAFAVVIGAVCAELPDVFWLYERLVIHRRSRNWFFRFHHWIQWSETQRGLKYELVYLFLFAVVNMLLLTSSVPS
jgi:hypothetical protein